MLADVHDVPMWNVRAVADQEIRKPIFDTLVTKIQVRLLLMLEENRTDHIIAQMLDRVVRKRRLGGPEQTHECQLSRTVGIKDLAISR